MWAQLITARLKPGSDAKVATLLEQLEASEQPGSGLVRSTVMLDQADPLLLSVLVMFDSEEHARAREKDESRGEALADARATMAEIFDGPPAFQDLNVVGEFIP
jgi:hypothetical protein